MRTSSDRVRFVVDGGALESAGPPLMLVLEGGRGVRGDGTPLPTPCVWRGKLIEDEGAKCSVDIEIRENLTNSFCVTVSL